jgi:hypothetical protein
MGDQSPRCGPQFVGSEPGDSFDPGRSAASAGGGGEAAGGFRRAIDEETLRTVADARQRHTTRPQAPRAAAVLPTCRRTLITGIW